MSNLIDLDDSATLTLARLQALTGRSVMSILGAALDAELVRVEKEAIRSAILEGAAAADTGRFTNLSVDEIFAVGMSKARQPATKGN